MRAPLLGTLVALLTVAALPSAASATRVEAGAFSDAGVRVVSHGCTDATTTPTTGPRLRIRTDAKAPMGSGSVGWTPRVADFEVGPTVHIDHPSTLSTLAISVIGRGGELSGHAVAEYHAPDDAGVWLGSSALSGDGKSGWHRIAAQKKTFQWVHYTEDGETSGWVPNATIPSLVTSLGGDGDGAWVGFAYGCNGTTFDVDALKVATETEDKTLDFEPHGSHATLLASGRSTAILIAGARQGLKASLVDSDGQAIRSKVTLWRAPLGSKKFRRVQTFTVGKQGTSTVYLKPVSSGAYRLQYPGTKTRAPSTSKTVVLRVHSNVRARLSQATVVTGNPFTVSGRFWPGRATRLLLQRYSDHRWSTERKLRSAKDGTYRVSMGTGRVGASYWRIYVPKSRDNLDGRSSSMRLITKARPHTGGGGTPTDPTPPPTTNEPDNPPPPPTGPQ
jgi:hypothetical protein